MRETHSSSTSGCLVLPRPTASFPDARDAFEIRAFSFFIEQVAPCLSGGLDSYFWGRLVPQISHTNPVLWNAILAISSLYECSQQTCATHSDLNQMIPSDVLHQRALRWYNKSLRCLSHIDNHETDPDSTAIISCILFSSIEYQQVNRTNAKRLLMSATDFFASQLRSASHSNRRLTFIEESMLPIFVRQYTHMNVLGCHLSSDWWKLVQKHVPLHPAGRLDSLSDARTQLFIIFQQGYELLRQAFPARIMHDLSALEHLQTRQQDLLKLLDNWDLQFAKLLNNLGAGLSALERHASLCLAINRDLGRIWLLTGLATTETVYDDYITLFENVVRDARETIEISARVYNKRLVYSFELGITLPLYYTACKCRHPALRRHALNLLHEAPLQEGLFPSMGLAKVCEKVVEIEEENLREELSSSLMPVEFPTDDSRLFNILVERETSNGIKLNLALVYRRTTSPEVERKVLLS